MSFPQGKMQWTVQVMSLENAGAKSQRIVESAEPNLDDITVGYTRNSVEEIMSNHTLIYDWFCTAWPRIKWYAMQLNHLFSHREMDILRHILGEAIRKPSPGTLMPIQNWKLPQTATDLRGLLDFTNYASEYINDYAKL